MFAQQLLALLPLLAVLTSTNAAPDPLSRRQKADAIVEMAKRQGIIGKILAGDPHYAPYEMPCPSDYTWVRPATVSGIDKAYSRTKHMP
jgi:hypothetical protein